ncbi:hypothetical protein GOODEAATRI_009763, partial [Goodea atripinnis]
VVSGLKYFITVQMEKTSCRKGRANEQCDPLDKPANRVNILLRNCIVTPFALGNINLFINLGFPFQPYQCTFIVWSRPWINDIRLVEEKC